jgi:hypothetical protein
VISWLMHVLVLFFTDGTLFVFIYLVLGSTKIKMFDLKHKKLSTFIILNAYNMKTYLMTILI